MPRLTPLFVPGQAHHVLQRGNNRQPIFFSDEDRAPFLRWLGRCSAQDAPQLRSPTTTQGVAVVGGLVKWGRGITKSSRCSHQTLLWKVGSMELQPLYAESCWHDGRGPELAHIYHIDAGRGLQAIDYWNPDGTPYCVIFKYVQVYMFTPEEVYGGDSYPIDRAVTGNAAIISFGRSDWLLSFAQYHLAKCKHFRIMFYDEYLDVICEDITIQPGKYSCGDPSKG